MSEKADLETKPNAKLTIVVFETLCVKSAKPTGKSAFVKVAILKMAHTVILEPFPPFFHHLPTLVQGTMDSDIWVLK